MGERILEGIVTSGLGKGAVFISIDYYKNEIKDKLGFDPYPGTLNLTIDKTQKSLLNDLTPIRIQSLEKDGKKYGGVNCYKIKINNIVASIVIPDMSEHEEGMIEIISPVNLKSQLNVKDGDKLRIELQ